MTSGRPMATASLPDTIQDHATFAAGMAEIIAGVLGEVELAPGALQVEPTDGQFVLTVGGRPALVGLSTASDDDVLLDEISLRLLRRLELWEPDLGPLRGVNRYLAQLGMRSIGPAWMDEPVVLAGERQMDFAPASIVLEVPAGVARRIGGRDTEAMINLRKDVFKRTGVELPDVRVSLTEPRLRRIRIGLNSTFVTVRTVPADAGWGYVMQSLERALAVRLHWFIRKEQVGRILEDLWYVVPDLVESCRLCYPLDVLTACLRELVRHGQSLRNLNRIMWLLLDLGSAESGPDHFLMAETPLPAPRPDVAAASSDPVALASRIRKCVHEEAWRVRAGQPLGGSGRLSADLERALVDATKADVALSEWAVVEEFAALDHPEVLIVRDVAAIGPVFDAVQCLPEPPAVISSQELPPDKRLSEVPVAMASST